MKLQSKTVQHLFIRLLGEDTSFGGPGCVYQDVASSECPEQSFGGLLAAGQLAQVGGMERRLHPGFTDLCSRSLEPVLVRGRQKDVGPVLCKAKGAGESDSFGSSGDKSGFAFKRHHLSRTPGRTR